VTGPAHRYALYWTPPPGSALAELDSTLFGRDSALPGVPAATLAEAVRGPARYGLHATLKAPFRLTAGARPAELHAAAAAFARRRRPVEASALAPAALGRYLALRPCAPAPGLEGFAAEVVRAFDGFRAPPDAGELARRRRTGLTDAQESYLQLWGYPYVFDEFRFHVTLAGPCDADTRRVIAEALQPWLARLDPDAFVLDALSVCGQATPEAGFEVAARYPLGG
jgi:hypothetical protein